jgi:alpha-tubulin suppressor-like RCC1 family protein
VGDGTCGDGIIDAHRRTPVEVLGIQDAVQIALGVWDTCAVSENGALRCWGRNEDGTLGTGDTSDHAMPTSVVGIDGTNAGALAVAATADHTCVTLRDGSLRCFGQNPFGELGDGKTQSTSIPVVAQPPMKALAVVVGGRFTCALVTNDSVACWGGGSDGELGNGAYAESPEPVAVELPRGVAVKTIVSKYQHTCVLSTEGRIWCWGANAQGQLGNGTVDASNRPVEVRGPADD